MLATMNRKLWNKRQKGQQRKGRGFTLRTPFGAHVSGIVPSAASYVS